MPSADDWILGATADPGAYDMPPAAPLPGDLPRVYIGPRPDERATVIPPAPPVPDDSKMVLGSDPTPRAWSFLPREQQATSREGSPIEMLPYDIGKSLEGMGVPSHLAYERGRNLTSGLSMLPGTGSAISWGEAKDAYGRGDYGQAALNTAMAVPIVPAAAAKPLAKGVKRMVMGEVAAPARAEIARAPAGIGHNMPPPEYPPPTGSLNPLANVPVTFRGKDLKDLTPDELHAFGQHYGVENLGPLSPLQTFKDMQGNEFQLPGGTAGNWTYADMLHMKANPINPANVDRALHTEMQRKLGRTMTPEQLDDAQVWNGLVFGMTSPNNPLFPNQISASRLRLRTPEMLDDLASMIPWKPGDEVPGPVRKLASDNIAARFGLQGEPKGGLGTRGTADYSRIGELAQMFKQDPSFFRKQGNETWSQAVERISSQVPGLSMKTGSFGTVWQDPAIAAISAIDRHMARKLEETGGLFLDDAERAAWEAQSVKRWNDRTETVGKGENKTKVRVNADNQATDFKDLMSKSGSDGFIGEMLLDHVGDAKTPLFRMAKGGINPNIAPHLANAAWVREPEKVFNMGAAYRRALDLNQKIADEHGLNLFMSQWMEWDRIRNRFEPHENMFPGLSKLPAPSIEQLRGVDQAHKQTGHKTYGKSDEGSLQPTRPFMGNPSQMGYLGIPGVIAGGALAGGLLGPRDAQAEEYRRQGR